jgi:phosphohistidine phosphatase
MAGLTIWLLRHAKTVTDPPKGGSDFDRVLAPRGRRDAGALGKLLAADPASLGLSGLPIPERALVSPSVRTRATTELVLPGFSPTPKVVLVKSFYGADPEEVLEVVRKLPKKVTSVLVVGHNPTWHALSQRLISKDDTAGMAQAIERGFPTCALGVYRFEAASWAEVQAHGGTLAAYCLPPFDDPQRPRALD